MNNILKNYLLFFCFIFFASCISKKKIVYFQNDKITQSTVNNAPKTTYKTGDQLQINVSALNLEAVKPFNLSSVSYNTTTNNATGTPTQQYYIVDEDGNINFPVIGKIKIAGLSRNEAIDFLSKKLDPDYIKNPTITIKIINYSVTILGDVKKPGTYNIQDERISVLEALGMAGDTNLSGERIIKVFREENNTKKEYLLDLRSKNVFSSPVYYLQQNDIVYIEPNKAVSQNAVYNKNSGLFISLGSVLISLIAILTR